MPRELITIQVGQCGNQIGCRFWDLALQEHAALQRKGQGRQQRPIYDEAMSSFFRNVDTRFDDMPDIPYDSTVRQEVKGLKARAVLVDMEQGVLGELLNDKKLGQLFDERQLISDVSGAGNNWAHGHEVYGPKYRDDILESIRRASEMCDSLQCFFLMHSLGGGTGSGLGTYILQELADEYKDVYRFVSAVFPSADDDVAVSPYNSMLALRELTDHADCVLPLENQALQDMCNLVTKLKIKQHSVRGVNLDTDHSGDILRGGGSNSQVLGDPRLAKHTQNSRHSSEKPFDQMNNIAARLITDLTSSMRFEGNLNTDLNEITTNLVPYPRMHYLVSSLSPLVLPKDVHLPPRRLDQMFSDAFSRDYQLLKSDPRRHRYLACGLLVRGNAQISDINRNVMKIKNNIDMVYWNQEGFKVGLCDVAPVGQPYSLLCLSNNCCVVDRFREMRGRFLKLYNRGVYVHHFEQYMDSSVFEESLNSIDDLTTEYEELMNVQPPEHIPRFVPEDL